MNELFFYILIYLLVFNIIASFRLLFTEMFNSIQKLFQIIIVWIIPFLGATIVSHFLNDEPIKLSEKLVKYDIVLKFLLLLFMIKIETDLDKNIGNNEGGYTAEGGD